jgi:hypothetical protein
VDFTKEERLMADNSPPDRLSNNPRAIQQTLLPREQADLTARRFTRLRALLRRRARLVCGCTVHCTQALLSRPT